MKKNLLIILGLSMVTLACFANGDYKTEQAAAEASHKTLKTNIEEGKVKQIKPLKKGLSKPELTYKIVSTKLASRAKDTIKNRIIESSKFDFVGNLSIEDSKTKQVVKYTTNGYFVVSKDSTQKKVKGQTKKVVTIAYKEGDAVFAQGFPMRVPYFETEALSKANELVRKFYDQHKEFVEVTIQPAESCQDGYKVTTSRTYYKDAQKYTGDKGTVIFTVKKADKLEDFQLMEQKEEDLTEFGNTPAPTPIEENDTAQEAEVITKDNRTNQEKLEQTKVDAFSLNSLALSDESKAQLDYAAQILLEDRSLEIELLGHTCDLGDKETNYNIGLLRAKEAKKYLVSKGVESNRVYVHSYGAKKPLVPNTNAENKGKNRRVEIKVIK